MNAQVLQWPEQPPRQPAQPVIQMASAPYVRIALAAVMFGSTEKAFRRKIEEGKWVEGREYKRSPDGEIYISVRGVTRWIEGEAG